MFKYFRDGLKEQQEASIVQILVLLYIQMNGEENAEIVYLYDDLNSRATFCVQLFY